jgi:hypothetical protein
MQHRALDRTRSASLRRRLFAIAAAIVFACSANDDEPKATLTREELRDPKTCAACHGEHFRQWSGSMHAYAADDPVFLAMNKRMIRETNGASASFCVGCHAPLALRLGLTKDGTNLQELPSSVRGVTCYFCHSVDQVDGTHNAALRIADDGVIRGPIRDPISAAPHPAVYSNLHDREQPESSSLCGACHDVITPHGAHIERTFAEWKGSLYAKPGQLACGKCHMEGRDAPAARVLGAPIRRVHDHSAAAVDVALTPFPDTDAQRQKVQDTLDATLLTKLCVRRTPLGLGADVTLDNAFAGHAFPSGANQDRRTWVELLAYEGPIVVFRTGEIEPKKAASKSSDPNLWLLRDTIFRADGQETHMFWEAARFEGSSLPPAVTADPLDPAFNHSVTRTFPLPPATDRVTLRVRMRPLDFDLLDDLVATGDLDPAILDRIPTWELRTAAKEWSLPGGYRCVD